MGISYEELTQNQSKAYERMHLIERDLRSRLKEFGLENAYIGLSVWGKRLVEYRYRSYTGRKAVREKVSRDGSFTFDYQTVVQVLVEKHEAAKAREAREELRIKQEQEFKSGLGALVSSWPYETRKALGIPYLGCRDDRVPVNLEFFQGDADKFQRVVEALAPILGFENPYSG